MGVRDDKAVVVTGSGRGIGAGIAKLAAREGASVVVTDIDRPEAEQAAAEIVKAGGKSGAPAASAAPGGATEPTLQEARRVIDGWVNRFAAAAAAGDGTTMTTLFTPEAYWREALGLGWDLRVVHAASAIGPQLWDALRRSGAAGFKMEADSFVRFSADPTGGYLEGFFRFTTAVGTSRGHLRLRRTADSENGWKAWTILTGLHEIDGHPESVGPQRPDGLLPPGQDWASLRRNQIEFRDRDPQVVVIGAAHAGLGIAARLEVLGIDTLVLERTPRVGDGWRNRYRTLSLHNEVWLNHLPYLPFPKTWPLYTSKDKLADWLEFYASALDLNVWTSANIQSVRFDEAAGRWEMKVKHGASDETRTVRPRHVVLATGVFGAPRKLDLPGEQEFGGPIVSSQDYREGADVRGKRVLVIGTGSSAHDIAQDCHLGGAEVTMLQRGTTSVLSTRSQSMLAAARYNESSAPIQDDLDFAANSVPFPLLIEWQKAGSERTAQIDAELLAGLERAGFRTDFGEDGSGFLLKFYRQGGGYYVDVGCSQLIIDGLIKIKQGVEVEKLRRGEVVFTDGDVRPFDMIMTAVGFGNMQDTVRQIFGDAVAERVGPVWGIGEDGELRAMWRPTGQKNFWLTGSSFVQSRTMSKVLALQIQGALLGLV